MLLGLGQFVPLDLTHTPPAYLANKKCVQNSHFLTLRGPPGQGVQGVAGKWLMVDERSMKGRRWRTRVVASSIQELTQGPIKIRRIGIIVIAVFQKEELLRLGRGLE
jgi:hypothetical protein